LRLLLVTSGTIARALYPGLSPRIWLWHFVDTSIIEYVVETPDLNRQFNLFISLGSRTTIPVTKANPAFLASLSREFGNLDLYISLLEYFNNDLYVLKSVIRRSIFLVRPDWSYFIDLLWTDAVAVGSNSTWTILTMTCESQHSIKADRNLIVIVGSIVMSSQMSDLGVSLSWARLCAAIKNVVIEQSSIFTGGRISEICDDPDQNVSCSYKSPSTHSRKHHSCSVTTDGSMQSWKTTPTSTALSRCHTSRSVLAFRFVRASNFAIVTIIPQSSHFRNLHSESCTRSPEPASPHSSTTSLNEAVS
jgi:hypothetical protein